MFGTRKELAPDMIVLEMIEADNLIQFFCLAVVTERRLGGYCISSRFAGGGFLRPIEGFDVGC